MKFITPLLFLILIPLVSADTTFFDNPDDAFIMGDSATEEPELGSGILGETTGDEGDCRYEWDCTDWSKCLPSGKQTRDCTNIGTCSNRYKSPEIEQSCTYTTYVIEKENEEKKPELVLEEKEIWAENEEEKSVEPSENVLAEENPTEKHNYIFIFYIVTLVAVLILRWIYYHWKEK